MLALNFYNSIKTNCRTSNYRTHKYMWYCLDKIAKRDDYFPMFLCELLDTSDFEFVPERVDLVC